MSIVHARIDERLIHGQVAMVWTNTVGATRIAVVNDEAVKDEMIIAGLKMAKPAGVKLSILSKKKAVEKFQSNVYDNDKVFLITKNLQDMEFLVENGVKTGTINVGNIAKREGSTQIKKSVYVTKEDIDTIQHLIESGIHVTAQMIPAESDQSITEYLPK